jgi:hypothetical protein
MSRRMDESSNKRGRGGSPDVAAIGRELKVAVDVQREPRGHRQREEAEHPPRFLQRR